MKGGSLAFTVCAALLLGAASCDRTPPDPSDVVVAKVGQEPLRLAELEAYLATHLPAPVGEEVDPAQTDEVKSRLLDALVEERLLLIEAERRGIVAQDWEVAAYVGMLDDLGEGDDAGGGETPSAADQEEARRRMVVQKLLEVEMRNASLPGEMDVLAYAEIHRERLMPERPLQLRALLFESEDHAARVQRQIRRNRITFNEAVIFHERYPGQGQAVRMAWKDLTDEVKGALEKLRPGRVSGPLELHGSFYLFQVDSWLKDTEQLEAELVENARKELVALQHREAVDQLTRDLHEQTGVRLIRRNLTFRYVEKGSEVFSPNDR